MSKTPSLSTIEADLFALGAKPEHIRRIFRAWLGQTSWDPPKHAAYPKELTNNLEAVRHRLQALSRVLPVKSAQKDCLKLLVGLSDGQCVESVLLPRDALCVSTQVGCAVGCVFCMTGKGGLVRQLSSAEIVSQLVCARAFHPAIKKVVFMGMGEPSHNLAAVKEAVCFIGDVAGFAHKEIVISSVGDRRLFEAMPLWPVKPALALSLHTTDNAKRRQLVPKSAEIPVEDLIALTLDYAQKTKYPAQIEWTLIEGVNDSEQEVRHLAELLDARSAMVNFIAVNPVAGTGFNRPCRAHIEDLITILREKGIVATLRESAAQDVEGGCGQLRARLMKEEINAAQKTEIQP